MRTFPLVPPLALIAAAQPDTDSTWNKLRSSNPPELTFSLRLLEPRAYHEGELISADLLLTGLETAAPQLGTRHVIWQFGGFLLDPPLRCGTLPIPCYVAGARFGGGYSMSRNDAMLWLGRGSKPVALFLNEYFPALKPGRYRAAALARKLVLTTRLPNRHGYSDPSEYAVSNPIEFEVILASAHWVDRTIAASTATLARSRMTDATSRSAAQQLRFLDRPAAWRASLDVLPVESYILLRGLADTREPAPVCELIQERIPHPAQDISSYYLVTMAQVCTRAKSAPPPPASAADTEKQNYWKRLNESQQELLDQGSAALAANLANKQSSGTKAAAMEALLERVRYLQMNEQQRPLPGWIPALRRAFAKESPSWDQGRRDRLLTLYASTIPSPDAIPLATSILDAWKPGDYYELPRTALRVLHQLDPQTAQARILAELTKPQTWLDTRQLDLLPPSAVPPMDDELIQALAVAQRPGGWQPMLRMAAIAKYGTPRALPRIKAIYESQQDKCQPELMAYFLRVDPDYADGVFHSQPWEMQAGPPPCALQYFRRTPELFMQPVLEKYMSAYLMHREVFVKLAIAQSLRRYGSPAALEPLWGAFRYFHVYWKGRNSELESNRPGVDLEVELRNAIARGVNWVATEGDLRTIQALCISQACRYETEQDLRACQVPLRISINESPSAIQGTIAQYYPLETLRALKAKLAQFPGGTQFVLDASGYGPRQTAAEIRKFAASRGLIITDSSMRH